MEIRSTNSEEASWKWGKRRRRSRDRHKEKAIYETVGDGTTADGCNSEC